ncbi:hypothetical protein FB45DRAFT_35226 [Roridomyces roridus]|uniref:F-box domain-containing protein n=1 Tax=Roridomyces roridus TaxID=1738132 RepID=A0AAD7CKZ2_9AGAR|nr:hypothetical protein FB45DRAFT_35226 [Roridomyces roridus]
MSPTTMYHSPLSIPELLDQILGFLDAEEDLRASALVRRAWIQPAQSRIFASIHFGYNWWGRKELASARRLLAILDGSQHLATFITALDLVKLNAAHLETLHKLVNLPFPHLTTLRIVDDGRTTFAEAESVAIQRLLRIPSLSSVTIQCEFQLWTQFLQIWQECSPNIRHLSYYTTLYGTSLPKDITGPSMGIHTRRIQLKSFSSWDSALRTRLWLQDERCPFDLSNLEAFEFYQSSDELLCDVLAGALDTVETLSIGPLADISRFHRVTQFAVVPHNGLYQDLKQIFALPADYRARLKALVVCVWPLPLPEIDPLLQLLSDIHNVFPSLEIIEIKFWATTEEARSKVESETEDWFKTVHSRIKLSWGTGQRFAVDYGGQTWHQRIV